MFVPPFTVEAFSNFGTEPILEYGIEIQRKIYFHWKPCLSSKQPTQMFLELRQTFKRQDTLQKYEDKNVQDWFWVDSIVFIKQNQCHSHCSWHKHDFTFPYSKLDFFLKINYEGSKLKKISGNNKTKQNYSIFKRTLKQFLINLTLSSIEDYE